MSSSSVARRPKWHPTPPPTPVIIHLPRRHRRKQHTETGENNSRREREKVDKDEKWRFDVLREECSLLRREREKNHRLDMDNTFPSALCFLGKKKRNGESNSGETKDLEEKLQGLLIKENVTNNDFERKECNNFNNKSFILQERLDKLGEESKEKRRLKEMMIAEPKKDIHSSLVSAQNNSNNLFDVEILRRKMEGIKKLGVYERMEKEYGAMLVSNTPNSASISKRFEFPDDQGEDGRKKCSGNCKTVVRKIIEEVREESKLWSEMQEMLLLVRQEMDQLKDSRDFWQRRALDSDHENHSLQSTAQEWKMKAFTMRTKAKALKREVFALREVLNSTNFGEDRNVERTKIKDEQEIVSLGAHIAKEKRESIYHIKEKENYRSVASGEIERNGRLNNDKRRKSHKLHRENIVGSKRFPFQDIGNNSASSKTTLNG